MNGPTCHEESRGDSSRYAGPTVEGDPTVYPLFPRLMSALFYAVSATLIIIFNKVVLTSFEFPSYLALGLGQMVITVLLLPVLRTAGVIHFPAPSLYIFKQVWPLPLLFLGNIAFSLGGTKRLSLPMYVVLRRFGNLFIMLAEYFILGKAASKFVQFTVFLMILGAFVAASDDLSFDMEGYVLILATNVCAALSGVLAKQKLNNKTLGTYGLLFYNSLFMVLPASLLTYITGDAHKAVGFEGWKDPLFLLLFLLACAMGFLISFSTLLSTKFNSALTTSIVGVLKNLIVIYSSMISGGDYVYSFRNFTGINISVVGGLMYSYATFIARPASSSTSNGAASKV